MNIDSEGRGGGFGKYTGLTIPEIQSLYENCVSDPTMRSISAVLRIAREQFEARGQLGVYPRLAWFAIVALGILAPVSAISQGTVREFALKGAMGAGCVFLLLMFSVIPTRQARRSNLAQEQRIREVTVDAVRTILQSNPKLKALTMEQETTVKDLIKRVPGSDDLAVLLNLPDSV
jgi:hypothetical protein